MRPLGTYRAAPVLPDQLAALRTLAHDLRFSWRPDLRRLFEELDKTAYERAGGNPIELLRLVDPARLAELASDGGYVERLNAAVRRLEEEDRSEPRFPEAQTLAARGERVAYFCAEFGITEILPIYSGGLGILAGDHLKSSSDIGIPLVGVGLFYREGFFRQSLTADSRQKETYPIVDPDDLPLDLFPTPSGGLPVVTVRIAGRDVHLLIRRARVGRVPLLLLDSHHPVNRPADREITSRLYGGDVEMRIKQEIVLGIGGMRALDLVGLRPTVRHANEGHAAFHALERIRQLRAENGLSFDEAREISAAGNVFTTHTPVPAGIDLFTPALMKKYFEDLVDDYGLTLDEFLGLGRQVQEDPQENFSMAVLGLRLSTRVNGVSRLHASVSRRMWRGVFPEAPLSEMPIAPVTNGVHPPTWTAPALAELMVPESPATASRSEIWRRHEALRARLVEAVRARVATSRRRRGAPDSDVAAAYGLLDTRALTITFARRFATYKRATLLFHDPPRLARLLGDPERPVQLLFAGKAHPRDEAGKEFIRRVGEFSQQQEFLGRVVLLEDYDVGLAKLLVSGSDVWLNNPRRPMEASGTSGMKAAMNGALNLSVRDGWWDEAPREAGFTIGDESSDRSDDETASALYDALEREVIPLFYNRDAGENGGKYSSGWLERMVASMAGLGTLFSTDRMQGDYLRSAYVPAADRLQQLGENDFARAKALAAWKKSVVERWGEIGFISVLLSAADLARLAPGETFRVEVQVRLGSFSTDEISVDWFEGTIDPDGVVDAGFSTPLSLKERIDGRATYEGVVVRPDDDSRGYSVRLRPTHADLVHPNETGLVLWAG